MCDAGKSCPLVARFHRGCEEMPDDRETCLAENCFWDGHRCREPLLRIELGVHVLGIDTASAHTVLAADTCNVEGGQVTAAAQQRCAPLTPRACEQAVSCRWKNGVCAPDLHELSYVSGRVPVIPWSTTPLSVNQLHADLVPYCSSHLFPQNEDGLVGLQMPRSGSEHALMHHLVTDNRDDHLVVMDKERQTLCIGEHCTVQKTTDITARPRLFPNAPLVQHDPDHRLLLDTGATKTTVWPHMCQIGFHDLEYLEVRDTQLRYKLAPGALDRCSLAADA